MALDAQTGAVRVMADQAVLRPHERDALRLRRFNRATQGRYPPGSTFKVVTAAAAHRQRASTSPTRASSGKNGKEISGAPLNNFGNEAFGEIDLTDAR